MLTAELLQKANEQISTVPIKGKEYAQVTERVKAFRAICPGGRITTDIISLEDGVVTMKAEVRDENGDLIATGLAQEKETSNFINKTSFIENCETSAVGRALGFAGIGVDGTMASAEELANAVINQDEKQKKTAKKAPDVPAGNGNGYPSKDEIMRTILERYPDGSKSQKALLASNGLNSINDMSVAQAMSVYNHIMKEREKA